MHNFSLKNLNTFGIDANCDQFIQINEAGELLSILNESYYKKAPKLVLGGGSNVLFTQDYKGIVLKNNIYGIEKLRENEDHVWLKVGAGEVWHNLVLACIEKGYAGIENLSLIPGQVGASPMQNIGAYGVEIKNYVDSVICLDLNDGTEEVYASNECQFGYRSSIFKTKLKGQKFISHVVFKLNKKVNFNTSYGAIEKELERMNITELSLQAVSQAVINIRSSKLPDPNIIGNAGSFFKNPIVDLEKADELEKFYPNIPLYPASDGYKKVAAGWMIEQAGWKGKRFNNHGVHVNQALVLVNYGNALGADINKLANDIQNSISEKFGVELEKEVNII